MNGKFRQISGIILVAFVVFTSFVYMLPLLLKGKAFNSFLDLLLNNYHGFGSTLVRTLFFAAITASASTLLGFMTALALSRISATSFLGRYMSCFLLPAMLGNVTVAFIFKVCFFNTAVFNYVVQSSSFIKMTLLGMMQVWQFGFLFAYLFWRDFEKLDRNKLDYGHVIELSYWEKLKDVIAPPSRNMAVLLSLIGFVFAFYESAKSQFIFKASQGTQTELISHWLQREYQSQVLVSPAYAISKVVDSSILVMAASLAGFLFMGLSTNYVIKRVCRMKSKPDVFSSSKGLKEAKSSRGKWAINVFACLCLSAIFIPLVIVFARRGVRFSVDVSEMWMPLLLTLLAAVFAALISISVSVLSRLTFRHVLHDLNAKSLWIFVSMFSLMLVPSLAVLLSGFQWSAWLGSGSYFQIYFLWIVSHIILISPLLICFLLCVHFGVQKGELEYVSAYSLTFREILTLSFVKRFKLEYILLLVIACTFIWNEAVINIVLSDRIPSFASKMQMLFVGRATDYMSASSYLLTSLLIATVGIFIWANIVKRNEISGEHS